MTAIKEKKKVSLKANTTISLPSSVSTTHIDNIGQATQRPKQKNVKGFLYKLCTVWGRKDWGMDRVSRTHLVSTDF